MQSDGHPDGPSDLETRFKTLVQSPLRAGLLRYLAARPEDTPDLEGLMAAFGRLRLDVANCVRELVDFGVIRRVPGDPVRYQFHRQAGPIAPLVAAFLDAAPWFPPRTNRPRSSASAR